MKILRILSAVLLSLIPAGCATLPKADDVVLPPMPERTEQKAPETAKDWAELLGYYEFLVQEWEAWGRAVQAQIKGEDPKGNGK